MFNTIDTLITNILDALGIFGPLLGCLLILIESILPILPLSVFITLNFLAFGNAFGFLISAILTIIGCNFSFYLNRRVLKGRVDYLLKRYDKKTIDKFMTTFSNIKFKNLVLLMAFPFTPAFLINIFAGISKIEYNKFLIASIISKPFMVFFWGYIGTTLIQSLTHPIYLLKIAIILLIAYILSNIINKRFNLD